jgi:glutamate-1-semialdehyde aminotransferase
MKLPISLALWQKAKKLIPGGSQLLSKRSEMFLPDQWPSYYKKAKGVEIWDLDENHYYDMTIMGVGSCILGYADEDVDKSVKEVIDNGSMSTLNSPEEVELAEILLKLHSWADAVRYTRTGGEMMAVAVRIARAHTRKDKIAFCGYHGWHDWYLSINLADYAYLDGHLFPVLDPNGVPRGLLNTAFPFQYNNIEKLEAIVKDNDIGVIVIEPIRHQPPENNFLHRVREVANEIGAVLIFDEITAGWRFTVGGSHLKFGVNPDLMVMAKAISNGYPMASVIGKADIMDAAQTSFISSTYWTERIGPTAAIATINKMQKYNVPSHLDKIGGLIGEGWKILAKKNDITISILPPNALVSFSFEYENAQELKTLFIQEMLNRGYLASTSIYISYCHTENIVTEYLKVVDEVFGIIKDAIEKEKVNSLLKGPIAHSGFQRLT